MTIANDILFLALKNGGIVGVGQTPTADDVNDSFRVLNALINEWNLERTIQVNPVVLPPFPDLVTNVPYWTPYEHVLLTSMAVRLRQIYALPPVQLDVQIAVSALTAFSAINLQQQAAPFIAADDGTGYGLIYLALRGAGRVNDKQGVQQNSQDVTDAQSILNEMLDEWQRERTVRVIQGQLPGPIYSLDAPLTLEPGLRSAIVLNLTVRLRDAFGAEVSKTLADRAERAINMVQAINQQYVSPIHPGPPQTVQDLIFLALRLAGRITDMQSVADTSKDADDAFSLLVMMLGQWQRKRWLVWNEEEVSCLATGNYSYTIGPGEDFDVARPDKIHAAFVRLTPGFIGDGDPLAATLPFPLGEGVTNPVDIPLSIIEAKEDWATIAVKDLKSIPAGVFYDSSYPVGQVYFWPVPPAGIYEMHLMVKAQLPVPTTVTDSLMLPPEYLDAVVNNLACRIIVASGGQISPFLMAQARASLNTIKLANSQIPLLSMPAALSGHRSDMSSWSGRGLNQAWIVGGTDVLL